MKEFGKLAVWAACFAKFGIPPTWNLSGPQVSQLYQSMKESLSHAYRQH